jgi:hypothetical protein
MVVAMMMDTTHPSPQSSPSCSSAENQPTGTMAVSAPNYVLEQSISTQRLWRKTAGNRPPQPIEERAYFEEIWAQNFLQSQVSYHAPLEVLVAQSPISMSPYADVGFGDAPGDGDATCHQDPYGNMYNVVGHFHNPTVFGGGAGQKSDWRGGHKNRQKASEVDAAEATIAQRSRNANRGNGGGGTNEDDKSLKSDSQGEGTLRVLIKGDNIFGTTVSKSFARGPRDVTGRIDTVSISIASYRVVQVSV